MQRSREVRYSGLIITQFHVNGRWESHKTRPDDGSKLLKDTMNETPVTGTSGSDHDHAKLSPSSSERWSRCTASPALEAASYDKIFPSKVDSVRRLTPFLESLPLEELKDHEARAIQIVRDLDEGRTNLRKLTPEQRKDIERSEGSVASRSGVRAHDFAEAILNGRRTIDSIPQEFQHPVGFYVDHCRSLVPEGVTPLIEYRVPLFYTDAGGTLDFGVVTDDRIIIRDYKNGTGKLVHSISNDQLAAYGLSLVREMQDSGLYDFSPGTVIDIKAVQPNHHEAAELKPWILSLKELEDFCAHLQTAADDIEAGRTEFYPSDETCQFCPVKAACPARAERLSADLDNPNAGYSGLDLLAGLPDDDEIPDMTKKEFQKAPVTERLISRTEFATNSHESILDDETMVALWRKSSAIRKFLDDIDEHLEARALAGQKIEGVKVVLGREGNREWRDEDEAEKFCINQKLKLEERCSIKLLGPAPIEKLLADKLAKTTRTANRFNELIVRKPGQRTIAPLDDKRPAVGAHIDDLPDDEDGL